MNLLVSRKKLLGNTGDFLWSYGGYLIVSALCDLCGVVLDESNARNFTIDCIETLHDTLKANLSMNGTNYSLSLNDELMSEFIFFLVSFGRVDYSLPGSGVVVSKAQDYLDGYIENGLNVLVSKSFYSDGFGISVFASNNKFIFEPSVYLPELCSVSCGSFSSQHFTLEYDSNGVCITSSFNVVTSNVYPFMNGGNSNPICLYCTVPLGYISTFEGFEKIYPISTNEYDIGDSYVKSLEEYKAKYEKEPSKIILDSSIADIKTKWKKEDTEIYIADGNIESLPSGVSLAYRQYLFKEGDQCTNITGGWKDYYLTGAQITNVCILLSQSETHNMFAGTINEIDFSKYNKIYLELESNTDFYLSPATSMSASWFSYLSWKEGTDRKIVSFNLNEEKKISTKIYCAIFKTGTAKIYNIWLE